jgi:hypothetical protein
MNKKYIQTTDMQKLIDWDAIMPLNRRPSGHDEHMQQLFKGATVIGHWNEGDYQGVVATCVKLEDGRYAIYNDYYGSCSGCDSWSGADDDSVQKLCIDLANGAYVFQCYDDVIEFLESGEGNPKWFERGCGPAPAKELLAKIKGE